VVENERSDHKLIVSSKLEQLWPEA